MKFNAFSIGVFIILLLLTAATLFAEEKPEIQDFAKRNLNIFLTPIPEITT